MLNRFTTLGFTNKEAAAVEGAAVHLGVNPYAVAAVVYNAHAMGSIDSVTRANAISAYLSATRSYVGA